MPSQKWEPIRTNQIPTNAVTDTPIFAKQTIPNGDPGNDDIRVLRNMDATIVIYIGAPGVTALTGFPLAPNESFILGGPSGYSIKSAISAIAASGTPKVAILAV